MRRGRTVRLLLGVVLAIAVAGMFADSMVPRVVMVEPASGSAAGITVSIIESDGLSTSMTDAEGVARFGRGRWSPLWGRQTAVIMKIERGSEVLWEGAVFDTPRWGPLRMETR